MLRLGKDSFEVPAPSGMRSFALQQRILPVAGRVINVFLRLMGAGSEIGKLLESEVMQILPEAMPFIGEIFSQMPAGELESITRELLKDATCNRVPLFGGHVDTFDGVMQGRTMETWQLLFHALEVWYPDFFTRARASFATAGKAKSSEVSSTSAGSGQVSG